MILLNTGICSASKLKKFRINLIVIETNLKNMNFQKQLKCVCYMYSFKILHATELYKLKYRIVKIMIDHNDKIYRANFFKEINF